MSQMKVKDKSPEKGLNEMGATKIPDTQLKTVVVRMLKDLRERMDDLSENLKKGIVSIKKDIEIIKMDQSEMKNTIPETKNTRNQ